MSIPISLEGKIALISGGSRGIGAATVRLFTAAGAKVVFSYRSAARQAEALAKQCGDEVCYAVASDLNSPEAARSLVAEAVKHFGRLDILVANHGVWPVKDIPIERMSDEQWRSTLTINLVCGLVLGKKQEAEKRSRTRGSRRRRQLALLSTSMSHARGAIHS